MKNGELAGLVDRLKRLLDALEWSGTTNYGDTPCCPSCGCSGESESEHPIHAEDCELNNLLKESTKLLEEYRMSFKVKFTPARGKVYVRRESALASKIIDGVDLGQDADAGVFSIIAFGADIGPKECEFEIGDVVAVQHVQGHPALPKDEGLCIPYEIIGKVEVYEVEEKPMIEVI